ncbi:5'-nucleotidase [Jatrophihabitans sp. GAS493]|uniref:5'-nucleotidase C-terminal domain-containing protein n=1 Tax=Jatrophihabitans sp. GAS493 TaxID=1907575 RepID=UPI000BBF9BBB|nr:5'-nucleotidase C-terminal domain-containing protein [Jatrophihabitans sp. GAS493]SOD74225.1 5'-nucleotidase [Jatrophihabitans sp. GAS493]
MPIVSRTVVTILATVSAVVVALLLPLTLAPPASAASSTGLVITEVYGGGGNSSAVLANDFVELQNRGPAAVDLTGYSVQYKSATGTSWTGKTPLGSVSLDPGKFYLIQEASGGANGAPLPAPDVTGTVNLSATTGTVALVSNATTLTCLLAACASDPSVADLVGFGGATTFEGAAAAPAPSAALSDQRSAAVDSDQNSADFVVAAPTPAAVSGGGGGGGTDCTTTPPPDACIPGTTTIQDIQGSSWKSPLDGENVAKVAGVVTAVRTAGSSRGFFLQELNPDLSRPAASSAIFVFTSSPTVAVGDSVLVSGPVKEFYPLASGETVATTSSLSTTEISGPTQITTLAKGVSLPAALLLTPTTVPGRFAAPGASADPHSVESTDALDPARSAQEFFEAHEGMLVQVNDAKVVGPGSPQYGEIYVTSKPDQQMTPRGGTYIADYDAVPAGRTLVAPVNGTVPAANVGDELVGPTVGPVDWSTFGGYDIAATQIGTYQDNGLTGNVAPAQATDQLAVATYNVENLAPSDPQSKFDRLATGVVKNLASPDVISVEEIQDNDGAIDDGVVAADQTIAKFIAAISAQGGPAYSSASIDPVNDQDGGQPGGNIRVVFLYNPARVTFDAKAGGDSTSGVTVSTGADFTAELSASPGRVDPTNAAWTDSRKPLAGEFTFDGKKVIVIANHFNSKGGDQNSDGRYQPPARISEVQRTQQATVLNGFVKQILAADPSANVVLAGDFNDYQFSAPIKTLTDDGATLTDLINTLPENERYTYNFNGISQVLDHIFVSKPLSATADAVQYSVIHVNSEFSDQASDHDPQVVRIRPVATPTTTSLNLLNINDFHGRIDANTVKFAGTVEQLRAAAGSANSLLLSAGDNIGASLFASASQNDQPTIDVLNAMGLDASAVGNHEFDKGYDDLVNRVVGDPPNAKWAYLGANVYQKGTTTPALPQYQIVTVNGLRVGVIGAVTQETPSLVSPGGITGIDVGDPVVAVNRVAAELTDGDPANGEADVLIAEYHEGASEGTPDGATLDQEVAAGGAFAEIVQQTSPKVAAIFTGHTHKVYAWDAPIPGEAGKTRPILQTGDYGANVGQVVLTIDRATKQVTGYASRNVPRTDTDDATLVAAYPRVAAVQSIVTAALAQAAVVGGQPIGKVTADITTAFTGTDRDDRASESTLGNLVGNALRDELAAPERGGAQIGVVNPGGLRADLLYAPDGTVTYAEANSVLPFVNNLWTLSLTGAQFKQVLEQMWQPAGASRPFLNLGLSDNVTYTLDPSAAVGSHITSVTIDGKPLDPNASYRIGTFSFLATGGDNFTAFTAATNVQDTGLVDRDAWIDYLGKNSPVSPSFARRGVVVSPLPGAVKAGETLTFAVSKLDLTSLGSPANTSLSAAIGASSLGSFPVSAGATSVSVKIPDSISGAQTLTLTAAPSGTVVTIPLSITAKPTQKGTVTLSPTTLPAGRSVTVRLAGWASATKLAIRLDATTLGSVTTDAHGAGTLTALIPRTTTVGRHTVTATTADGTSVSASLQVQKACVPVPGPKASLIDWLAYLVALAAGRAC